VRQREKNPAHIGPFCPGLPEVAWGAVVNISVKKTADVSELLEVGSPMKIWIKNVSKS
jgi:hypothetical protein